MSRCNGDYNEATGYILTLDDKGGRVVISCLTKGNQRFVSSDRELVDLLIDYVVAMQRPLLYPVWFLNTSYQRLVIYFLKTNLDDSYPKH